MNVNYLLQANITATLTKMFLVAVLAGLFTSCLPVKKSDFNPNLQLTGNVLITKEDASVQGSFEITALTGKPLASFVSKAPKKGTVELLPETPIDFRYQPNSDAFGEDVFELTVTDGEASASATMVITIEPVNDPPMVSNLSLSTSEDTAISGTVVATDIDSANRTLVILTQPTKGSVVTNPAGTTFTYTPTSDANGPDSFTFAANDEHSSSNTGIASITIQTVNDPPVAQDGNLNTAEDTTANGTLPATDVDNTNLMFSIVTDPAKGAISNFNANTGTYTYTPHTNITGADSFTFRVNDGSLNSNIGTIKVAIRAVNDPPTAANMTLSVNANAILTTTLEGSDPDGDVLTYFVTQPDHGGVILDNTTNGAFTYQPAEWYSGPDSFTYRVNDGTVDSDTATISITVNNVGNPPVAKNGVLVLTEDETKTGQLVATDNDSTALTFSIVDQAAKGTVTITNVNTGAYQFVPTENANDADSFSFKANDTNSDSNIATITVTITAVNDPPIAQNGNLTTNEDIAYSGTLPASDPDSTTLTFSIVENGAHGSAVVTDANIGTFTYTPNQDYFGPDSIQFRVSDGTTNSNVATMSVSVVAVNDSPVASSGSFNVLAGGTFQGTLPAGQDVDGDSLTYSLVTNGSKGTATIQDGTRGSFRYVANANASGTDSFTYKLNDGQVDSLPATITTDIAAGVANLAISGMTDFGKVYVGDETALSLTVNNTGPVAARAITGAPFGSRHFVYTGGSYPGTSGTCGSALGVGASCVLDVSFYPQAKGQLPDSLSLKYFDGVANQNATRNVTGEGYDWVFFEGYLEREPLPVTRGLPFSIIAGTERPGGSVDAAIIGGAVHLARAGRFVGSASGDQSVRLDNWDKVLVGDDSYQVDTFGNGGKVIADFGMEDQNLAVDIQPDGKIITAGYSIGENIQQPLRLVRYNLDGSLDGSFGTGGVQAVQIGTYSVPYMMEVAANGDIYVVGYTWMRNNFDWFVIRLDSGGTSMEGYPLRIDFRGGHDYATAILLLPNGDVIVGGRAYYGRGRGHDLAFVRLNGAGDIINYHYTDMGNSHDFLTSLDLGPDGKILVGGRFISIDLDENPAPATSADALSFLFDKNRGSFSVVVARYNADLSVDTSFSNGQGGFAKKIGVGATPDLAFGWDGTIFGFSIAPEGHYRVAARSFRKGTQIFPKIGRMGTFNVSQNGEVIGEFIPNIGYRDVENPYVLGRAFVIGGRPILFSKLLVSNIGAQAMEIKSGGGLRLSANFRSDVD